MFEYNERNLFYSKICEYARKFYYRIINYVYLRKIYVCIFLIENISFRFFEN